MLEIGRIVIKLAGRDARGVGVIIEKIDDSFVVIDGAVRRKKVNIKHIEPLPKKINVNKNTTKKEILDELLKMRLITKEVYEEWINKEK
jgi:large subunit ribosomal protein L14e